MAVDLLSGRSPAQVEAVMTPDAPLAIIAGPGSGKTRVLTRRVAYRCQVGTAAPLHCLVVTFSRRAAVEMQTRLTRLGVPIGAPNGGVVVGTFHALAYAEVRRDRAERHLPAPSVLGRPARLMRPILAGLLGRRPTPEEVDGVLPSAVAGAAQELYAQAKRERQVLDLDDLLAECTRLLSEPSRRAVSAWRHRHLFVDEYQDLNPAHHRLLGAWVGDRPDLCVVGDPGQAIYGFNGASPDLFDRLADDWPGAKVLTLDENFRCSPEVVAMARAVRPEAGPAVGLPGPLPTVTGYADQEAEAAAVAMAAAGSGSTNRAVLARTNGRLRLVAGALDRLGVPWRIRDPRPLADRRDVRAALDSLPPRAPAADLGPICAEDPQLAVLAAPLAEFRSLGPGGTVGGFASWLDLAGVTADEGAPVGVDLATFHRAKGLEWDAVWVIGVDDGLVPLFNADEAEEQRLLYVALTRARDELAVSWSDLGGPSPWIPSLDVAQRSLAAELPRDEHRARWAELLELVKAS
jgi:DNA helicase-2/ATP-dependent DNA helicase PcrA